MSKKATKRPRPPSADTGPQLDLPPGTSEEVPPENLLLDPQNLRLFETASEELQKTPARLIGQRSIQAAVYELMLSDQRFDVDGLVKSIAHNGFLKHERLIVAPYDGSTYLVLEGNRRLTAVRRLKRLYTDRQVSLSRTIAGSMQTLPCFILEGSAIDGLDTRLAGYRRAAELYIGMRHLMEVKSWDPASRYEFQARLIFQDNWTPEEVADRFGRKKRQVQIELKAQVLYHDFRSYEKKSGVAHNFTYNAFAEAARSGAIMRWLEWSDKERKVGNRENEHTFFHYLIARLRNLQSTSEEGEETDLSSSAELAVRRLSAMLTLQDPDINGALLDREFDTAELLFESRKEGKLAKRLAQYIRQLRRVTLTELKQDKTKNRQLLQELASVATEYADAIAKGK